MNEKLKEFLDAQKKKYEEKKKETLIELGLYERVYPEKGESIIDFPYAEYDSENSKTRWYKKEAIDISDEEYEEVKKYSEPTDTKKHKNSIATILRVIGVIIYFAGFIASLFLGLGRYGDITTMVLVYWVIFFISGTCFLGFAEIIQLLNDIKNK